MSTFDNSYTKKEGVLIIIIVPIPISVGFKTLLVRSLEEVNGGYSSDERLLLE